MSNAYNHGEALRRINLALENNSDYLSFSGLKLRSPLPSELAKLKRLRILDLSNNRLSIFPEEVLSLTKLEHLDLSNNRLETISADINQLKQLCFLYLYKNRLSFLPRQIGQLKNLIELKIHNNHLTEIPQELANLHSLNALFINFNNITSLPSQLGDLTNLSKVMLDHNPLPDTVLTAASRGLTELLSYLRSLREETENLYEAKLILVGEGGVGKTSLVAALNNEPFVDNRDTTHGIEMCRLTLLHPEVDTNINLNVWDFGGQPVYRITHQFFYSKRSLYLLLWSPRRGVELSDVEGWIKRIKLRIGDSARIIIVATHSETGGRVARIDKEGLIREFGDIIVGFHEVDSKTLAGIEFLKTEISKVAARLPQMGSPFSLSWKRAREMVLAIDQPRITFDTFSTICSKQGLDPIATSTLADLMHDLGYVVYYGDDEGLRNEIILRPEWLSKAIGYVLEDKDTNEQKGVLEHERLRYIWFEHGYADRERYPLELHPYFLRLMEKYDASYRLEGGTSSLVAQLVPNLRPTLPWTAENLEDINDTVQVTLVCQMEDEPPGLVPWMIVRTHHFSTRPRLHWQRGMFLQYEPHGTALVELRNRELHLAVRASWPNYFIEVLRYILNRLIEERWPGLEATFSAPCPTLDRKGQHCKGRFPLTTLQKLKSKFDSVPCLICSRESSIEKLLTGFEPPDMRQQLRRIERGVAVTMAQAARAQSENAARFRLLLRAMNEETRECPHLFTLLPKETGLKPNNIGMLRYTLTLWCEMPSSQHPVCLIGSGGKGEYVFERAKPWLVKIAPYASLVAKTLKTVIPLAGATIKDVVDETLLKGVKGHIDLMDKATSTLLQGDFTARAGPTLDDKIVSDVEGASLRELYSLLSELDPAKNWGGLRRTVSPTGDYLWLCQDHYQRFDPGLPTLDYVDYI